MGTRVQNLRAIFQRRNVWVGLVALGLIGAGAAYYNHHERGIEEHPIEPVRWTVRDVVLVHSLLGQGRYIPLERWQLHEVTNSAKGLES